MALSKESSMYWTETETLTPEPKEKALTPTERTIAEGGSRLLSVIPVMFPERLMMKAFKEERDEARVNQLTRFWRDNGPWALRRSMRLCNLSMSYCKCRTCSPMNYHCRAACVFFQRVVSFANSSGLSVCVMRADENTPPDLLRATMEGEYKEMDHPVWPKPAGFDCETACRSVVFNGVCVVVFLMVLPRYMKPVSHIPVDIVFQHIRHHLVISYGRPLWEVKSLSDPKIRKLDLLFASLHR